MRQQWANDKFEGQGRNMCLHHEAKTLRLGLMPVLSEIGKLGYYMLVI